MLVGVGATLLGFVYFDAVAAIIVALMIAKIGVELSYASFSELIDSSLDQDEIDTIREQILGLDEVNDVHALRTRRFGGGAMVDAHVMVREDISVSEGHMISERISETLITGLDWVLDVLVHIDIEDDETEKQLKGLPLRSDIEKQILAAIEPIIETGQVRDVKLHYLQGSIRAELHLPFSGSGDTEAAHALSQALNDRITAIPHITHAEVHWICS